MVVNDTQCFWREKLWKNAFSRSSRTMGVEWCLFDVFMGMEHCVCLVCIYVWCVHEPTAEHASPQNKLDEAYQVTARQI